MDQHRIIYAKQLLPLHNNICQNIKSTNVELNEMIFLPKSDIHHYNSKNRQWYSHYNCTHSCPSSVLLRNITLYRHSIIIAVMNKRSHIQYSQFNNVTQFMRFFQMADIENRSFYAVFRHPLRHPYMDIDYKLNHCMSQRNENKLINLLINKFKKFLEIHGYQYKIIYSKINILVWNASRNNKFSLHIIDSGHVIHISLIEKMIQHFNYLLAQNHLLPQLCTIDTNIYHNNYQLWRLPGCHTGNINSTLRLISHSIPFKQQLAINLMADTCSIAEIDTSALSTTNKILEISKSNQKQIQNSARIQRPINNNCYTQLTPKIRNQISNLFQTNIIQPYHNEILLKHHLCPFAERKHKNNTARLDLLFLNNQPQFPYLLFRCMDSNCQLVYRSKYISLTPLWQHPWIISTILHISNITIPALRKIDLFFTEAYKHKIIHRKPNTSASTVLLKNKIWEQKHDSIFTTFLDDKIVHTICGHSNMQFQYRNTNNKYISFGPIALFCKSCHCFVNFKFNIIRESHNSSNSYSRALPPITSTSR